MLHTNEIFEVFVFFYVFFQVNAESLASAELSLLTGRESTRLSS